MAETTAKKNDGPERFVWGAATSAFQIEGATAADGRGRSIWDDFCARPGRILDGGDGAIACDHYRRYRKDIRLLKELGVTGYRFSISWPRIIPDGVGNVNPAGVDFYNRLLDELIANGIEPFPTLYHWDLPTGCRGGWLEPVTAEAFAAYAKVCFDAFGDRVKHWITLNESWCSAVLGYGLGVFAPGMTDPEMPYRAGHHLLLAHGLAVREFRNGGYAGEIGIANNCDWREPLTDTAADRDAAERALQFFYGWFTDPLFTGEYPETMRRRLGGRLPEFSSSEKVLLTGSADFLGLNHYTTMYASDSPPPGGGDTTASGNGGMIDDQQVWLSPPDGCAKTDMGWAVVPWGLRNMLRWIAERYGNPPIYVTENGCSDPITGISDPLEDAARSSFIRAYTREALAAKTDSHVDLRGYFYWSLLDNFEWTSGYQRHFGLIRCTPDDLRRRPKKSFDEYRKIIEEYRVNQKEGKNK
ncbi:MAG: GH1 family beta-glucosidase [Lentisphaeria bacterium]|nr:GH1 family beta-glucosidase [Lentisphaeria bacterium]